MSEMNIDIARLFLFSYWGYYCHLLADDMNRDRYEWLHGPAGAKSMIEIITTAKKCGIVSMHY